MFNKTIWLLWLQGWESAPWLIKQVAQSWEINNPDWNIKYLTQVNLREYVHDIDYIYDKSKAIEPQHKADIIRLSLLKNHGGVWADATMLCMQPLTPWVEEAVKPAGLWMYHGHGGGMNGKNGPAIWFIASEKDSLMINKWKQACDEYWQHRTRTDNYFWLDGLFKKLFDSDPKFRNKWELAPHLYCELKGQAHYLAYRNRIKTNKRNLKKIFREKPPYVLKLWWKLWEQEFSDISSAKCKESNGFYAIEMSKRKIVYKHKMSSKKSISFHMKMFFLNTKHFLEFDIKKALIPFKRLWKTGR